MNVDVSQVYRRCGCLDPVSGKRFGATCPKLAADADHGSWYFAAQVTDRQGHRRRIRQGGYRTAAQAAIARRKVLDRDATAADEQGWTVEKWLREWLSTLPDRVRTSTLVAYTSHVEGVLIPELGHVRLRALTSDVVQRMFTNLRKRRNRYGAPLTASTIQRIRATLRRALNAAIGRQLIATSPARSLDLPSPRHHRPVLWTTARVRAWRRDGWRPPIGVWTPQLLARFLSAVPHDELFALWGLAGLRGLRRGELLGLRWIDVDLDDGTLTVAQELISVHGAVMVGSPKTAAAQRTITIDRTLADILREHRQRMLLAAAAARRAWDPQGLVFTQADGTAIGPDWLTHHFTRLVRELGLPPIRLHDLRHGAAMLALAGNATIHSVQHLLGHSSYAFTADTYGTVPDHTARAEATTTAAIVLEAIGSIPARIESSCTG